MNQGLSDQITTFITKHNLLPEGATIIVGLSGGPDSVFLLHFLHEYQKNHAIKLIAAHLDHEWRADSYKDVEFCRSLTDALGIPLHVGKLSKLSLSLKFNGSKEELGRKMRRHFFETVLKETNATAIALAHHQEDQQETFFIRLLRGASLPGLTAMKPRSGYYIRPLLETSKNDIVAHLEQEKIIYLTDPTNSSDVFLRNRIRHTLLPALKLCDDRFAKNFMRTLEQLQETEDALTSITHTLFEQCLVTPGAHNELDASRFLQLDTIFQQRILVHWFCLNKVRFVPSQALFDEITRFIKNSDHGQHQIYPTWKLVKKAATIGILS